MGAARTTTKMLATALLVAGLTFSAAACGSKDGAATTTTAKSGSSTTEPLATTTTLNDSAYDKFATSMAAKIKAAGTDQCKIDPLFMELSAGEGTSPATPQQVEKAVNLTVQLFDAMAASAGPARAKEAADIKAGGEQITEAAEKNGYSVEWIRSPDASSAFSPTFATSLAAVRTDILKNCGKG